MRFVTGFVGAISEAWAELRIHRTRVLLSLIGVAIAICALTAVAALGSMVEQSQREAFERGSGRPAMLSIYASESSGKTVDPQLVNDAFEAAMDRYRIDYASRVGGGEWMVQLPYGVTPVGVTAVDQPYGAMHRVQIVEGRWFTERDELRLAPALIINEYLWTQLGSPPLATHPTLTIPGENPTTGVIVGVTPSAEWDTWPQVQVLYSSYLAVASPEVVAMYTPSYEAWVPPELADQLMSLIQADIAGSLGETWQVDISRSDYLAWGVGEDPMLPLKLIVGGVAILILILGALGLLTISIVTVKSRIREIGIRRSFGASAGRIFFAVMMESVVATFVAGFLGVLGAVLLSRLDVVREVLLQGAQDIPPFPWEAAAIGLVAATVVGALAGLIPALIAVRVKVIDAIRI